MRREKFESRGVLIESSRDWNGRYYTAWRPHVSMFFRDRKALTKWLSYPTQTPTRALILAWLDELDAKDAQRTAGKAQTEGITPELQATGFGPEVFLDETDPNFQCKTIV